MVVMTGARNVSVCYDQLWFHAVPLHYLVFGLVVGVIVAVNLVVVLYQHRRQIGQCLVGTGRHGDTTGHAMLTGHGGTDETDVDDEIYWRRQDDSTIMSYPLLTALPAHDT